MWTVKDLIECLQECPQDYIVTIVIPDTIDTIEAVGIDKDDMTVDIFTPY